MWNSLDLQCPIEDMVSYLPPDYCIMESMRDFVTLLTTAADALTSESPLWNEVKVLHNIQVKYKRILRCDRFLIHLQRVSHCLRKMVLINLSKSFLDLAERFLCGFHDPSGTPRLPSRQQVEYILIRTLSASKLVSEAISYSQESFCFIIQKLKVGHLILDLVMATSVVARLNILLRATLEKISSIYKQVLYWRYKVKDGEFQWSKKLDFPQSIEEWITTSEPTHLKPLDMSKEDIDKIKSLLNQMNGVNDKMDVSDTESVVLVNEIPLEPSTPEVDIGVVIPRKEQTTKSVKSGILTRLQKSLLLKIMSCQSLKLLEDMWFKIKGMSQESYPVRMTRKQRLKISKLFDDIKANFSYEKFIKTYESKPEFLKKAILYVCKVLGFTEDHIKMYSQPDSSDEVMIVNDTKLLTPVKTVKKLSILYEHLREILENNNDTRKLESLDTIYIHRLADARRLKKEGKTELVKKLIFLTSKEFLALYQ